LTFNTTVSDEDLTISQIALLDDLIISLTSDEDECDSEETF